jgi:uncharacterized membrane protein SpoIIM required for sporulation
MNIQRWLRLRRGDWEKLQELLDTIEKKEGSGLTRENLRELGALYRLASADLSRARVLKVGEDIRVFLNNLVVKAHNQVYQSRRSRWYDLADFLSVDFPKLVRRYINYVLTAICLFLIPLLVSYCFVLNDIGFAELEMVQGQPIVSEDIWQTIEQHKLWTDPLENVSPVASSLIATNNIKVTIMAFVLGITFGFGTAAVLFTNGVLVGTLLGVCRLHGMAEKLLIFIAPHGILELTAIFISGGAGLLMGKALLFPGQWKRFDALKMAAPDALSLFIGCIPLLVIAGLIEGFISPRTDIDGGAKLIVSGATLLLLVHYLLVPRDRKPASK